jgi:hypothetical protein
MMICNEAILAKLSGAAKRCKCFSETLDKARSSGLEMSLHRRNDFLPGGR